jgi:MFS family permease
VTPFRRIWVAQTVSLMGDFIAVFAVQVAVIFRLHETARAMSAVFIVSLLPGILLGPAAGAFADRWNPVRTMVASDVIRGALVIQLALAPSLERIYAVCFLLSCVSCFFSPAQAVVLCAAVPRERWVATSASLQQSAQLVRILGPAAAGALANAFGERACYYADALSFGISAAVIATLRLPAVKRGGGAGGAAPAGFMEGAKFLWRGARVRFAAGSLAAGVLCAGCFSALAPAYVRDVLRSGPGALGMMGSAIAIGTLTGSAAVARTRSAPRSIIRAGVAAVGMSILAVALFAHRLALFAACSVMGAGAAAVTAASAAELRSEAPEQARGRVSGAAQALTSFAQLLAMLAAPLGAAWFNIREVYAGGGLLLLAISTAGFYARLKRKSAAALPGQRLIRKGRNASASHGPSIDPIRPA